MTGTATVAAANPGTERPEESVAYAPRSLRQRFANFGGNGELYVGGALLLAFLVIAVLELAAHGGVPWMAPDAGLLRGPTAPSRAHPLGVLTLLYFPPGGPGPAQYGVDELTALGTATPVDLALFAAILIPSALVGALLGARAGAAEGGAIDLVAMAWGDVTVGVPPFLLVAILYVNVAALAPATEALVIFVGVYLLILWPYYARVVRAQARIVAAQPYVLAAVAVGSSELRILRRHILPNSLAPVLAQVPADLAGIFLLLTTFPYLSCEFPSFGLVSFLPSWQFPEWGYEVAEGACNGLKVTFSASSWWMFLVPVVVVVVFGVGVALLCDGLQRYVERATRST